MGVTLLIGVRPPGLGSVEWKGVRRRAGSGGIRETGPRDHLSGIGADRARQDAGSVSMAVAVAGPFVPRGHRAAAYHGFGTLGIVHPRAGWRAAASGGRRR